jgi:hypothetical protein
MDHRKGAQKGRETCPFRALDSFDGIRLSALERMAGTTRLELATSAVTEAVRDCQVLDNTHKSATSRVEHRVEKCARIYLHILRRMSRLARKFATSEDAIRHECI